MDCREKVERDEGGKYITGTMMLGSSESSESAKYSRGYGSDDVGVAMGRETAVSGGENPAPAAPGMRYPEF